MPKPGQLIAAIILIAGFTLSLAVAASAEPLRQLSLAATTAATGSANKVLPRHFKGAVTGVNTANKTFSLDTGTKKIVVATNEATKFQTYQGGKKNSSFDQLVVGSRVAVIGDLKGSTLTAKIVFVIQAKTTKRHADRGTVTALSGGSFTFVSQAKKNTTGTANITTSTVYTKKVAGKITRVSFSDLAIGDRVSFVGTIDAVSGVITAKLVHIIPAAVTIKSATSSAK